MKNVVINDMKDYVKKYGRLILLSIVATGICFGFLALSSNIRIDTEELINHPGSTLGWLTIGRFSLAFFKGLLGLGTHSALKSGLLFLIFFIVGANLLTFALYHFSGKKENYPYWVFILLYCTSNIWSFQVYFSVQQAEVALAMLLVLAAAFVAIQSSFYAGGFRKGIGFVLSASLLVLGLGAYQALAAYYIAVCIALFLLLFENKVRAEEKDSRQQTREFVVGIVELAVQFGISYLIYSWIAGNWFMATEGYMQSQKGWGRMAVADCIHAILLTGKNVLTGYGPRNFSFFPFGVLLALCVCVILWKEKIFHTKIQLGIYLLALAGLLFTPFLMTAYMGEMLVTRSQFALPVVAAFLGMYGIGHLRRGSSEADSGAETGNIAGVLPDNGGATDTKTTCNTGKWRRRAAMCAVAMVLLTGFVQTGYNLRLAYTDYIRQRWDEELTEQIVAALEKENGGTFPEKPVVFVGCRAPEYEKWCARTEMYGQSFYEWDYSRENPTGATHRIAGFIQAYTGNKIKEEISETMRTEAVALAQTMPDFPDEGAVLMTDEFVVVRLSEEKVLEEQSWW